MTEPVAVDRGARALLQSPVRWRGILLGRIGDLFVDRDLRALLGLEVECLDERPRFLAIAACETLDPPVATTPLALLEAGALDFYRTQALRLTSLLGLPVLAPGGRVGRIGDLLIDADGSVGGVVIAVADGRPETLAPEELAVDVERSVALVTGDGAVRFEKPDAG